MNQYEYRIFCGSPETMQTYAERGVKGINRKTKRWQLVDKSAKYEVKEYKRFYEEGKEYIMTDLYSDKDLHGIAEKKGLIL